MRRPSPEKTKVGQSATAAFETRLDASPGNWLVLVFEEDRRRAPGSLFHLARRNLGTRHAVCLQVGCIILGRGEDDQKVRQWLTTAAGVPGFIGFAVGRTTFWDALVSDRAGKIPRPTAVAQIAASYREWVGLFQKAR
jgi:hypothetical protein